MVGDGLSQYVGAAMILARWCPTVEASRRIGGRLAHFGSLACRLAHCPAWLTRTLLGPNHSWPSA